jgi:hypothetical protein
MKKQVKSSNQHEINLEIEKLRALIPLAIELNNLLEELKVKNISEFEEKLNERSGFTNALMSATAYGLEPMYKKLLLLEKELDGKLSLQDLTPENDLKPDVISEITDRNTVYFTPEEIELKEKLIAIKDVYNSLDWEARRQLFLDRSFQLVFTPFSQFR